MSKASKWLSDLTYVLNNFPVKLELKASGSQGTCGIILPIREAGVFRSWAVLE